MSTYQDLKRYYDLFGMRAVLSRSIRRLFRMRTPREVVARARGVKHPVRLRLKTTDVTVYKDVLIDGQYAMDFPFAPATIVDAGANIGVASIYYANRYPKARIIAIEPEASNYAMLRRNVARYPNIVAIQAALWNKDGLVGVAEPDPITRASGHWAFVTRQDGGTQVRAITMETLIKEMQLTSIDILKVDIEGAEKELFQQCDWLDRVRALAIELHDRFKPGCSDAVNAATQKFSRSQRGELNFYLRPA